MSKPSMGQVETLVQGVTIGPGDALWCKVVTPETKFKPEGEYEATVILDEVDAAKVIDRIDEAKAQWAATHKKKPEALAVPYSEEVDQEGNATGRIKFKAKCKAATKYGPRRVAVYDSTGKQLTKPVEVGNGSVIRIKVDVRGYKAGPNFGISLMLQGLQIIELKQFARQDGGFDAVEGGFKGVDSDGEGQDTDWDE